MKVYTSKEFGLIYMYVNKLNNKKYIGKSMEYRFTTRVSQHRKDKTNSHFARAKKKYGLENFNIIILEDGIPRDILSEKEIYYISLYDTMNNGYNSSKGGEGGDTFTSRSEESKQITKLKMSHILKTNNGNKGQYKGNKNPMYGITPKHTKLYDVIDSEDNNIIYKNKKAKEVLEIVGYNKVTNSSNAVRRVIEKLNGVYNGFKVINKGFVVGSLETMSDECSSVHWSLAPMEVHGNS